MGKEEHVADGIFIGEEGTVPGFSGEAINAPAENRSCGIQPNELSPLPLTHISSIFTGFSLGYPLNFRERLFLGLIGCSLLSLFVIASCLTPDRQGYGTHQQLGLPPCSIRTLFEIPCPTCGMTTSFAHFVRGDLVGACRVNPAGLLVACACFLLIPWSLAGVIRARLLWVSAPIEAALTLLSLLVGVSLLTWIIQIV